MLKIYLYVLKLQPLNSSSNAYTSIPCALLSFKFQGQTNAYLVLTHLKLLIFLVFSCCPCRFVARPRGNASAGRDMAAITVTGPKNTLFCNFSHCHFRHRHFRFRSYQMDFNTCKGAPLHGGATLAVSAVSILSKFHKNPNNEKPKYQKFKILRTSKISLSLRTGI